MRTVRSASFAEDSCAIKSSDRVKQLAHVSTFQGDSGQFCWVPKPASSEKSTPIGTALRQYVLLRFAFCAGLAASVRGVALLISDLLRTLKRPPFVRGTPSLSESAPKTGVIS